MGVTSALNIMQIRGRKEGGKEARKLRKEGRWIARIKG